MPLSDTASPSTPNKTGVPTVVEIRKFTNVIESPLLLSSPAQPHFLKPRLPSSSTTSRKRAASFMTQESEENHHQHAMTELPHSTTTHPTTTQSPFQSHNSCFTAVSPKQTTPSSPTVPTVPTPKLSPSFRRRSHHQLTPSRPINLIGGGSAVMRRRTTPLPASATTRRLFLTPRNSSCKRSACSASSLPPRFPSPSSDSNNSSNDTMIWSSPPPAPPVLSPPPTSFSHSLLFPPTRLEFLELEDKCDDENNFDDGFFLCSPLAIQQQRHEDKQAFSRKLPKLERDMMASSSPPPPQQPHPVLLPATASSPPFRRRLPPVSQCL